MKDRKTLLIVIGFSLLLCYANCSGFFFTSEKPEQYGGEVGNPMKAVASNLLLGQICVVLTQCNSTLTYHDCTSGVLATAGVASQLGLPSGTYDPYSSLLQADVSGQLSSNPIALSSCLTDVSRLSCSSPQVQNAYNPTSSTPFAGVAAMIPHNQGACASTFQPWRFVDRGSGGGINIWPTQSSSFGAFPTTFNSKLYASWIERSMVQVGVYNGNDNAPSWNQVTGSGLNYDSSRTAWNPTLLATASNLYAAWTEKDSNEIFQVRVAAYNNNDSNPGWNLIDGGGPEGLNALAANPASYTPALIQFNSKLYIAWTEADTPSQVRISVYKGNNIWGSVTGSVNGININPSDQGAQPTFAVFNSRLYISWVEDNANGIWQTRLAVYNGNDGAPHWTPVDNGSLNVSTSDSSELPNLIVFNSKLYVGWDEQGFSYVIHFKAYNGNDSSPAWTAVDRASGGSNYDLAKNAQALSLFIFNSHLYATWQESDPSSVAQIRVMAYNGLDSSPRWGFADGGTSEGINFDKTKNAYTPHGIVLNSKIYTIWQEEEVPDSQTRAAVELQMTFPQ